MEDTPGASPPAQKEYAGGPGGGTHVPLARSTVSAATPSAISSTAPVTSSGCILHHTDGAVALRFSGGKRVMEAVLSVWSVWSNLRFGVVKILQSQA
jgi:hypothetical protein